MVIVESLGCVFCELGGLVFWPSKGLEVVRGDGRARRAFGELYDDFW